MLKGEPPISDWNMVPYVLSYSYGVFRRALVGTLLHLLGVEPTRGVVLLIYTLAVILFFTLFYLFAARVKDRPLFVPFLILFVLSPFTGLHLGDDLGRTDVLLASLLMASLLLPKLSFGFTAVAILIHEGYLLLGLPALITVLLLRRRYGLLALNVAVGVGVLVALRLISPGPEILPLLERILAERGLSAEQALIPLTSSPLENTLYFYGTFLSSSGDALKTFAFGFVATLGLMGAYAYLFWTSSRAPILCRLIPLAPLLMFLLGIDYFRWGFFATLSMAVAWVEMYRMGWAGPPGRWSRPLFYLLLVLPLLEILREVL